MSGIGIVLRRPTVFRVAAVCVVFLAAVSCASPRPFDAQALEAGYETALEQEDLAFFDDLLSRQFWFGNQFATREAALDDLRRIFREYERLDADLEILSEQPVPGGRSWIVNSRLTLRGLPIGGGDGRPVTLAEDRGASVFVLEAGRWRLYKAVEKPLSVPGI